MVELKVRKIGNSLGVVLPQDVVERLHTGADQALFLVETPGGGYQLTALEPAVPDKMAAAEDILDRYKNTLETLSK